MYPVDNRDTITELTDVPQSDVGAPLPLIICDEMQLYLAYSVQTPITENESIAIVTFNRPYCHMFGPPNDEAFIGHPLAGRGLQLYSASEVFHSSWIRQLERMNAVHQYHSPERFLAGKRHFIFAFHDSTFECIAHDYAIAVMPGSMETALAQITEMMQQ